MANDYVWSNIGIKLQENAAIYSTPLTPINNNQPAITNPNMFFTASYTTVNTTAPCTYYRLAFTSTKYVYTVTSTGNGNVLIVPDDSAFLSVTEVLQVGNIYGFLVPSTQTPLCFNTGTPVSFGVSTFNLSTFSNAAPDNPFSVSVYCW